MKLIKILVDEMLDEVCGSKEYSCLALEYQYSRPQLAEIFHKLSGVELSHAKTLHEQVELVVKEMKDKGKNLPQEMLDKYDELHKEYIAKLEKAHTYYNLY